VGSSQQHREQLLRSAEEQSADILAQANALPEMPPQLADAGDVVKIEYTSPLALAQRAGEGVAISGMIEDAVAIQQFDPTAVKVVKWGDAFRTMAEVRGVKPSLLHTPAEMEEIAAGDAQKLQAQEALAAAEQAGKAAKDFAGAQALAGTTGLAPDVLGAAA